MREGYIKTNVLGTNPFPHEEEGRRYLSLGRPRGREVSGVKLNAFESHFDNQGDHFSRKFLNKLL